MDIILLGRDLIMHSKCVESFFQATEGSIIYISQKFGICRRQLLLQSGREVEFGDVVVESLCLVFFTCLVENLIE